MPNVFIAGEDFNKLSDTQIMLNSRINIINDAKSISFTKPVLFKSKEKLSKWARHKNLTTNVP